jgi:hypothetical protein
VKLDSPKRPLIEELLTPKSTKAGDILKKTLNSFHYDTKLSFTGKNNKKIDAKSICVGTAPGNHKELTEDKRKQLVIQIENLFSEKNCRKLLTPQNNYSKADLTGNITDRTKIPSNNTERKKESNPSKKQFTESCCATAATNSYIKQKQKQKQMKLVAGSKEQLNNLKEKIVNILTQHKQRELALLNKNKILRKENEELKKQVGKIKK